MKVAQLDLKHEEGVQSGPVLCPVRPLHRHLASLLSQHLHSPAGQKEGRTRLTATSTRGQGRDHDFSLSSSTRRSSCLLAKGVTWAPNGHLKKPPK